jgi:hypothetical protein
MLATILALSAIRSTAATDAQEPCTLTEKSPKQTNVPLSFCKMFIQDVCCDPAIDSEIGGYYTDLLGVSDLCAAENSQAHISLKYLFCFGCNPNQMRHVNADTQTVTLCPNFVAEVDPVNFEDCGLLLPGIRKTE